MTDEERLDPELEGLQRELRAALFDDPIPPDVLHAARVAWTWRVVDAELAELLAEDAALVRTTVEAPVTYAAGDLVVDVERIHGAGPTAVVVGLVTGAPIDSVVVELVDAGEPAAPAGEVLRSVAAELDASGGFRAEVPRGRPARVVVNLADGRRVVTGWLPT